MFNDPQAAASADNACSNKDTQAKEKPRGQHYIWTNALTSLRFKSSVLTTIRFNYKEKRTWANDMANAQVLNVSMRG